jgi:O-antigen/teichoic acid export membrane protein
MQGDRFVIGSANNLFVKETYSKTQLGFYSAAFVLSSAIGDGIGSILSPVMLPLLSSVQNLQAQFLKRCNFCIYIATSLTIPLGIFFILMGGWLLVWAYGNQYLAAAPLMAWFGATQSIRLIRLPVSAIAMSKGDTLNPTIANVFRAFSFVLAFIFAARGTAIVWIAASGLIGEFLATAASIVMIRHRLAIPMRYFVKPSIFLLFVLMLATLLWNTGVSNESPLFAFFVSVALSVFMVSLFLLLFPDFRKEIKPIVTAHFSH